MPDWMQEMRARLTSVDLEPTREKEIVAELAQHAADRYQELLATGVSEEDAYRQTLAELADARLPAGLIQGEAVSKVLFSRRFPFAARILAKHWKLTVVAVVSLAIAIAASAAGLSVFNALLLRLPAAASPEKLMTLYE